MVDSKFVNEREVKISLNVCSRNLHFDETLAMEEYACEKQYFIIENKIQLCQYCVADEQARALHGSVELSAPLFLRVWGGV